MTHCYNDEASRLAANTRKARAALRALDRCGHPVLTADRAKAQAAIETAVAAEAAYWTLVAGRPITNGEPLMTTNYTANIARCIEKLDSILPETAYVPWRKRVNLETLDMSSCNTDIIAQVFGYGDDWDQDEWSDWAAYLIDIEDPDDQDLIDHGLDVPTVNPTPGVAVWVPLRERHAALTAAWVAAITNSGEGGDSADDN